ncbi:helix-turn-helix transcriptional regulator [Actinokineospora enzanensis]|uniref:helix-turn-helix transcriptional regulator n=1 Tax=Actinokineospora enzanensis TaxID=155975 RepID=UPI0003786925|nr:helix-turn-helix domain-containing protein [Actinokineospora enzanensis]
MTRKNTKNTAPVIPPNYSIDEVCAALKIRRSTFYEWRAKKRAPRCRRLPNGRICILVADYESWFESLDDGEPA